MAKIVVVDSQRAIRNTLKDRLTFEGYQVSVAENRDQAMVLIDAEPFDLMLCSMELFCDEFVSMIAVIVISDQGNVDTAISTMQRGAAGFLLRPIDQNRLFAEVRKVLEVGSFTSIAKSEPHSRGAKARVARVESIVGGSASIQRLKMLIDKVAPSEARVLITGSNGTGKELVARWLHEKSRRCQEPFIEVNCAAIPSELIESELFGHEKGAFTSAVKQRKGKFEQADGGTLFLDEIGDMSLSAQAKVLRALQEKRISRVGSDKDLDVNVRVVAATNKNLQDEIHMGNFREDLYHRLSVIVIKVPTLADRRDDIPMLVDHFLQKIAQEYNDSVKTIDSKAVEELQKMDWTGNIRELRNVVERLVILSGKVITLDDIKMYVYL